MGYYSGENNINVGVLRDVLMTYMMFNFDLGYVQVIRLFFSKIFCFYTFKNGVRLKHSLFNYVKNPLK